MKLSLRQSFKEISALTGLAIAIQSATDQGQRLKLLRREGFKTHICPEGNGDRDTHDGWQTVLVQG